MVHVVHLGILGNQAWIKEDAQMKRSLKEILQDQRNIVYPLITVIALATATPCPSWDMVCELEQGAKPTWLGR